MEQKQSEGRVQIKAACCILVLRGQHNSCGSAGPRQSACVGCLDGISSNLRANEIIIYTSVRLTAGHRRLQRGGVTFLGCATVQADVVVIKRQAATTSLFLPLHVDNAAAAAAALLRASKVLFKGDRVPTGQCVFAAATDN